MINEIIIGTKIADARKKRKLSQAHFAELLAVSPQAVSKWERGESMPDIIMLSKIAEIFCVDLNYFANEGESSDTKVNDEKCERAESDDENYKAFNELGGNKKRRTWNLSMSEWRNVDFSGIRNEGGRFNFSTIANSIFKNSGLSDSNFIATNINSSDFTNADLSDCKMSAANLTKNNLNGAKLNETVFSATNITNNELSEAVLHGTVFKATYFSSNSLKGVVFENTLFRNSKIKALVFESDITDCTFHNCHFTDVEFRDVVFRGTMFKGCNLKKVLFSNCKADRVTYSFLANCKADMSGVQIIEE